MKQAIFAAAFLVTTSVSSFAQGSVVFKNFGGGSNGSVSPIAYVTDASLTKIGGASYLVQLYAGTATTAEGSLAAIGSPFAMLAGGLFGSPTLAVPGVAIGANAHLQARVWAASGGATYSAALAANAATGKSAVLTIALGDAGSTTPNSVPTMVGMTTFVVTAVPEPVTLALVGIGGLGLLALRRKTA